MNTLWCLRPKNLTYLTRCSRVWTKRLRERTSGDWRKIGHTVTVTDRCICRNKGYHSAMALSILTCFWLWGFCARQKATGFFCSSVILVGTSTLVSSLLEAIMFWRVFFFGIDAVPRVSASILFIRHVGGRPDSGYYFSRRRSTRCKTPHYVCVSLSLRLRLTRSVCVWLFVSLRVCLSVCLSIYRWSRHSYALPLLVHRGSWLSY